LPFKQTLFGLSAEQICSFVHSDVKRKSGAVESEKVQMYLGLIWKYAKLYTINDVEIYSKRCI